MSMNRTYVSLDNLTLFWAAAKQYIDSLKVNGIEFGGDKYINISGSDILAGGAGPYKDLSVQGAIDALSNSDTQLGQRINTIETSYVKSLSINGDDGIGVSVVSKDDADPHKGSVEISIKSDAIRNRLSVVESTYTKSVTVKDKDTNGNQYVTATATPSNGDVVITIDDSKVTEALAKTTDLSSQEYAVNGKNFYEDTDHNVILVSGDILHKSTEAGEGSTNIYTEIESIKSGFVKSVAGDSNNTYVDISFSSATGNVVATIDESKLVTKLNSIEAKADAIKNGNEIPYSSDEDTTTIYAKVNSIDQTVSSHISSTDTKWSNQTTKDSQQDTAIQANAQAIEGIKTSYVTSFGSKTGAILVDGSTSTNGHVRFTMNNNTLTGAVQGLGSLAYSNSSPYTTDQIEAIFSTPMHDGGSND